MKVVCRVLIVLALALAVSGPAAAWPQNPPPQDKQKPAPKPEPKPDEPQKYEETVVVTSSKAEEKLVNAPSTMTVIGPQTIQHASTQNFADLLRTVPGVNVTQVSARDINLTSRGATGTLATGQLALLDGRSMYQDFFGFVMWDFLPINFNEIKQIEVIRGPASAVWGANAVYGVVNVITKSPREMQGTSATLGFGSFDRKVGTTDMSAGSLWYISGTHAQAINDRWAYKLSAGGFSQDALPRPTGVIPGSPTGTSYPAYGNEGTMQPKFDARVDYDYPDGRRLSFAGGFSGTEGIMHTGIGPFDIKSGSTMSYAKVNFTRGGLKTGFFTNILDGDAANLLTRDVQNRPITFDFRTKTFDFEASNLATVGQRNVISYGGNLRFNQFDLSLAPNSENRTEFGLYGQDEIFLSDHFRWVVGARVDRFDYIDNFVFSPRTTFMIKPRVDQTFRVSYNRAYRSPSVINNFLDVTLAEPINLTPFAGLNPAVAGRIYPLPIRSVGNQDLQETSIDAFETSYSGQVAGRVIVSVAWYVNKTKNDILFTEVQSARYTATNPPPGWAFGLLPPQVIAAVPGGSFPALFTYQNFGETTQKGFEFGLDTRVTQHVNVFANYSWQGQPKPKGFALSELNLPPTYRVNAGMNFDAKRCFGNLSLNHTDGAFWQDVLDDRYHGRTKTYTLVNAGVGAKWGGDRLTTAVKVINLANSTIQQHVFGDILKRQIIGELKVQF
jgi:outer membrane receptor protein involved in Fe transport